MATKRVKAVRAEVVEPLEVLDDDLSVDPIEPPVMKVVERREYTKPMDAEPAGMVIETEPHNPMAWIDQFVDEVEAGNSIYLRVERLPNWMKDGRTGVQADREFLTNIPLTRESADNYEEQVQRVFGAGHYQFEIRGSAGRPGDVRRRWTRHISGPPGGSLPNGAPVGPGNYTFNYPPPGAPAPDLMKLFKEQIGMARDLVSLGQSMTPPVNPQTALAPVDPNNSPAVVELRTRMEMFEKIAGLAPEKQAPLVQLVKGLGLLGGEEEVAGGQWLRIIEGLTPVINMGMALLMQRLGGAAPQVPQGAQPIQPAQGALPPQPAAPPVDPAGVMLAQVVNLIGTGIAQGQSSNPAEAAIEELVTNFPNSQAAQQCELILTRPPQEVAAQLSLTHPDAVRWLGVLQTNWKQHEAEDVEDERNPTPPEVLSFGGAE